MRTKDLMLQSIDKHTDHVLTEIDELIRCLNTLRIRVIEDAEIVKEKLTDHMNLGSEATATVDKIASRMAYLAAGGGHRDNPG